MEAYNMGMEKSVVFSIIVPVYNVREYLCECVQSVLAQTFSSYELILVDDGSTDGSGALCDELAEKDARLRVYHQKNQGASTARNHGLTMAKGEYVLFLDSDDFYPQKEFLETLRTESESSDMICFNYARYTDRLLKNMISFPQKTDGDLDSLWLEMARRNAYQSSPCIKAVKRQLLLENNIFFEPGILSEDIEWCAKVMCAVKNFTIVPECIYAYRVRAGSVTKTVSPRHVRMQIDIITRLTKTLRQDDSGFGRAYNSYVAFQYCALMINGRLSKPKVTREEIREIKKMAWLLRYDTTGLVKLIHTVYSFLGFACTSWLLLIYFKLFCK